MVTNKKNLGQTTDFHICHGQIGSMEVVHLTANRYQHCLTLPFNSLSGSKILDRKWPFFLPFEILWIDHLLETKVSSTQWLETRSWKRREITLRYPTYVLGILRYKLCANCTITVFKSQPRIEVALHNRVVWHVTLLLSPARRAQLHCNFDTQSRLGSHARACCNLVPLGPPLSSLLSLSLEPVLKRTRRKARSEQSVCLYLPGKFEWANLA
jgi:hypothetical protein